MVENMVKYWVYLSYKVNWRLPDTISPNGPTVKGVIRGYSDQGACVSFGSDVQSEIDNGVVVTNWFWGIELFIGRLTTLLYRRLCYLKLAG